MKSFNEAASEVARAARGSAPPPATTPPVDRKPGRPALACEANGCPLAGSISEGTRGQGPWLCADHFFRGELTEDQVTLHIRNQIAAGAQYQLPRDRRPPPEDTPTVRDMKSRVLVNGRPRYPEYAPKPAPRDRVPGEDDE